MLPALHAPSTRFAATPLPSEEEVVADALQAAGTHPNGASRILEGRGPALAPHSRRMVFQNLVLRACRSRSTYLEARACLQAIDRLQRQGWCEATPDYLLRLSLALRGSPEFSPSHAVRSFLQHGASANAPSTRPGWSCAQYAAAAGLLGVGVELWWNAGLDPRQVTPEGESLVHLLLKPEDQRTMVPLGSGTWPAILSVASRWTSKDWRRLDPGGALFPLLRKSWDDLMRLYAGSTPEWDARPVLARAQAEAQALWLEGLPAATAGAHGRF